MPQSWWAFCSGAPPSGRIPPWLRKSEASLHPWPPLNSSVTYPVNYGRSLRCHLSLLRRGQRDLRRTRRYRHFCPRLRGLLQSVASTCLGCRRRSVCRRGTRRWFGIVCASLCRFPSAISGLPSCGALHAGHRLVLPMLVGVCEDVCEHTSAADRVHSWNQDLSRTRSRTGSTDSVERSSRNVRAFFRWTARVAANRSDRLFGCRQRNSARRLRRNELRGTRGRSADLPPSPRVASGRAAISSTQPNNGAGSPMGIFHLSRRPARVASA